MAETENHLCYEAIARAFRNFLERGPLEELIREAKRFMIWFVE